MIDSLLPMVAGADFLTALGTVGGEIILACDGLPA